MGCGWLLRVPISRGFVSKVSLQIGTYKAGMEDLRHAPSANMKIDIRFRFMSSAARENVFTASSRFLRSMKTAFDSHMLEDHKGGMDRKRDQWQSEERLV